MKVFTTGQVAKICKVAPRTVSKWFDSGRLKGYRIPGSQDRRIPREYLIRFLKEHGVEVNMTLHFDNVQMIKEAVAHGSGVSIMPARVMEEEVAQGRLVPIRIAGFELFRPVGIVHRRKKRFATS